MLRQRRRSASSLSRMSDKRTAQVDTVRRTSRPVQSTFSGLAVSGAANHPLVDGCENGQLYQYETSVKKSFDAIVPALRKVSAYQHDEEFVERAQSVAMQQLGFELPEDILRDAWVEQLDMRSLFAWCVFNTYQRYCDDFFSPEPLSNKHSDEFKGFIHH